MAKLLLNTAEEYLQNEKVANQLPGLDLYDLLVSDDMLPLLVEKLKQDDCLACQLFQSAYVDRPQEAILNACPRSSTAMPSKGGNSDWCHSLAVASPPFLRSI